MLALTGAFAISPAALAQQVKDIVADTKLEVPYAIDQRGVVARNSTGLCWRTGSWTPQSAAANTAAGCACDKDLLPREKCEPPAPPPAAAPAPAPAPAAAPAPAVKSITIKGSALFAFDQTVLKPEGRAVLDKDVIAKLNDFEKISLIMITGHTDRLGSHPYNQKLSEKRADAVRAYLESKAVKAGQIETLGAGKTQAVPGVSCSDKLPRKKLIECLAPNRRVEVEIKGTPRK
ncbi:MAG: OmpA family protein [Betaproteobacteria bacterium]|nr:OmpA family protein [Betaproteobacteria bacterium]